MLDIQTQVAQLRRPTLLIKAARFGIDDYNREPHLRRVLKGTVPLRPGPALILLLDVEKRMNDDRTSQASAYTIADHIDVLIAIMAEADTLRATTRLR